MGEITHDEAASILASMHFGVMSNADESIGKLYRYIRQQRAASGVRVVRIVDVTKKYECCKATQLLPGQSLAIIERRAEAAAGEGA